MHWVPAEGTSHPETFRITQLASRELRSIPGVRNFGAHIGRAIGGDEPYGINFTENWISVDPKVDYDKTRASVEAAVDGYPGLYRDVQTYLKERIKEVLTGASDSIVVRIFGPDLSVLRKKAQEVEHALKDIPGLMDLHPEQQVDIPQIQVRVNLEAAARHGLKPGDVRRAATVFMSGLEVTDIHREGKVYDVFVWAKPVLTQDVDDLRGVADRHAYGGRVRLEEVADVDLVPTPNKIKRENNSRRIDVDGNVKGRDLGSVARGRREPARENPLSHRLLPATAGRIQGACRVPREICLMTSIVVVAGIFLILFSDLPELAAVQHDLSRPAGGAGRRRVGNLRRRPGGFTRFPGGHHHDSGPVRAKRHHAHRALSASGESGRRTLRPRAHHARGKRTLVADPDDHPVHRLGAAAADHSRENSRSRDRAPDGGGHSGRCGHVELAEPFRHAASLPSIRVLPFGKGMESCLFKGHRARESRRCLLSTQACGRGEVMTKNERGCTRLIQVGTGDKEG